MNFFSGPADSSFSAKINMYNIHYKGTHILGSAGSNANDLKECLGMIAAGKVNPALMITHVGGLSAAAQATVDLPKIPGGKKLIYTHADMPLTAIADCGRLGETDPFFAKLHELCEKNNGLWNTEAEAYLLKEKTV
jgi:hypothetical protein